MNPASYSDWGVLIGFVAILCGFYYWFTKKNYFEKHGIVYKKPLLFLGNLGPALLRQKSFAVNIQDIYNIDKEARYVGYYDFARPTILLRDPELIKIVGVKNFDHFVDHRGFIDPDQDPLFGKVLFSLRGKKWSEMRHVLSPAFTSSKMKGMFRLMAHCAENFSDYLVAKASKEPLTIQSKDAFTRYTNDVIASCAFGVSVDSMRNPENEFYVLGKKATNFEGILGLKFLATSKFPILSRIFGMKLVESRVEAFFTDIVKRTVEMRDREGITRPDMLQLMMETRRNQAGEGPVLSLQDMTAQAFSFFFGGFDTTSSLMCFTLHGIAAHPEVQDKLQEEVDAIYEACKGEVTYEAITGMQYLDAVINETGRMYPIGAFLDRVCTKTFELPPALPGAKPVLLRPGDQVYIPVYPLHRNAEFFPKPDEFRPERFIEDPKATLHNSVFMPFGLGPRMCIANRFAILETKVLVFNLVAKCLMKPGKQMILPLELSKKTVAMTAEGGFWLTLEVRDKWRRKETKIE
uniref:Cytochrome P450 n=1 Tax=Bracon brevicornis TaxID=1563983 RepID=A0A6V7L420_9HYME